MDQTRPPPPARSLAQRRGLVLAVFTGSVFTSALLLFAVQPMFTRMVLPRLGGSPSVWSVAMVFFQSMLLAGYAYAHLLVRLRRPALAAAIHVGLLVLAGLTLPLAIAGGWGEPPANGEALWLLALFTISIGLPFFALAANNPLLQAWFVDATGSADPYFLYAASNLGSFLALLSYPVLLEPLLPLQAQNAVWTAGFAVLVLLIALCAVLLLRNPGAGRAMRAETETGVSPRAREVGRWIFLSAVPSGLLVAVTAQISTDVAAVPLLWVVPLAFYLLSWILVFQSRPLVSNAVALRAQAVAIAALIIVLAWREPPLWLTLPVHLLGFSIIAVACHGQLAQGRPQPRYLTSFYLALSAGGALGGLFSGLLAPFLFSWIAEYPILIALAALSVPFAARGPARGDGLFWACVLAGLLAATLPRFLFGFGPNEYLAYAAMGLAVLAVLFARNTLRFGAVVVLALVVLVLNPESARRHETLRSFFGVHKIWETPDGRFRVLEHGTTVHGAQKIRDEAGRPLTGRPESLTYYHPDSALAESVRAVRAAKGGPIKVAVVGLGTGSLACARVEGEAWTYFEIDPDVVRIAQDPRRFSYLQHCAPNIPIVVGDARLTLAKQPDGAFDLIVVDAFSSDSIPVHLLTREAMAVYRAKVGPQGAVIMHISNRHLELGTVVAGIAAANGLKTWIRDEDEDDREDEYIFDSTVAISAPDSAAIGPLARSERWDLTEPPADQRLWTDDYSNIVGSIVRKWRE